METAGLKVVRGTQNLMPDDNRVITRFFDIGSLHRVRGILKRILRMSDEQAADLLEQVRRSFAHRHRDLDEVLRTNYAVVARYLPSGIEVDHQRRLLIGAYFMMEYSVESAALFNPSIVMHPDQGNLPAGSVRFLMSLRATGEGHVSSIVFRRGVIDAAGDVAFDPPPRYAYCARPMPDRTIDKRVFFWKLMEMGAYEAPVILVLDLLPARFTVGQLRDAINEVKQGTDVPKAFSTVASDMLWLAEAHYELHFPPDCLPAETVIFPATENERRGMEDLRLVRFEDSRVHYYGTYTAYDGRRTLPMLLDTSDFTAFRITTISGKYARNKGMALFPRRHEGAYLAISRHDGENLYLLRSRSVDLWNESQPLYGPTEPWELIQIGNCGSPLETEAGWILLTHGVGPVRQYCIGALLLDRQRPERVIGRLRRPLLVPGEQDREGYVPNVVYSCGSMIHNERLIIPYAMADSRTAFAEVSVPDLVRLLRDSGPNGLEC